MYAMRAYQQYRLTEAQTADRGDLVVMLYQGATKYLVLALSALKGGNVEEAHNNLLRGQDIIVELMASLNTEAGDISAKLFDIYEYMHHRLVQANLKKDAQPVEEVLELLRELLPAWQQAARQWRESRLGATPPMEGKLSCVG